MKSSRSFLTILFALAVFTFTSCSDGASNEETTTNENTEANSEDKSETEKMLEKLSSSEFSSDQSKSGAHNAVSAYLMLKKSLVNSDPKFAQVAGENLAKKLDGLEGLSASKSVAESIAESEDIEEQRLLFYRITNNMYSFLKSNPIEGKKLYYQFCPMAFDNKGAHWISESKEIRNPYFGDKMMECGKTEEEL